MKKLICYLSIVIFTMAAYAQVPQGLNYQTVIRDTNGNLLTNADLNMQVLIHLGSATGTVVYQEGFKQLSNQFGLVSFVIGKGVPAAKDTFATIDWSTGPYFVEIKADITGGTDFVSFGSFQLMSVPYALYAEKTKEGSLAGTTGPTGATGTNGDIYATTSLTSLTLPAGVIDTQYITLQVGTGLSWQTGQVAIIAYTDTQFFIGRVASYVPATGAMIVHSAFSMGAGTFALWRVSLNGDAGPQGAPGPAGPTGYTGPIGPTGGIGLTGANGSTWLNGTGTPGAGLGKHGDYYLDNASGDTYINSNGTWNLVGSLLGPVGNAGAKGAAGPTGVAGPTGAGVAGPAGPTGAQGTIGLTGPQGPMGPAGPTGVGGGSGAANLSGTKDYVMKFVTSNSAGNSSIFDAGNGVGIGTATPNASAALDVTSTKTGFLMPRMTTNQRDAIVSPTVGLQIFNTDDDCVDIYDGKHWILTCGLKVVGTGHGSSNSTAWTQMKNPTNSPIQQLYYQSFSINGIGYFAGGYNEGFIAYSNQTWSYDPVADVWSQKANLPAYLAHGSSCAVKGNGLIFGGDVSANGSYPVVPTSNIYNYDPVANTWQVQDLGPDGIPADDGGVVFTVGDSVAVFVLSSAYIGAFSINFNTGYLSNFPIQFGLPGGTNFGFSVNGTGYVLETSSRTIVPAASSGSAITNLPEPVDSPRVGYSNSPVSMVDNKALFILGNDFWQWAPVKNIWTALDPCPSQSIQIITHFFDIGNKAFYGFQYAPGYAELWAYNDSIGAIGPTYQTAGVTSTIAGAVAVEGGSWTVADSTIYNSNTGNVGIGTTKPVEKFQVGDLNTLTNNFLSVKVQGITPGNSTAGIKLRALNENTGYTIQYNRDSLRLDVAVNNNVVNGVPAISIKQGNGFVGINNSNPQSQLSVIGNSDYTGNVAVTGRVAIGLAAASNTLSVVGNSDFSSNVGIGITTARHKLEVHDTTHEGTITPAALFRISNCGAPCNQSEPSQSINLQNANNTANNSVGVGFSDNGFDYYPSAWIGATFTDKTNHYANLAFKTRSSAGMNSILTLTGQQAQINASGNGAGQFDYGAFALSVNGSQQGINVIVNGNSGGTADQTNDFIAFGDNKNERLGSIQGQTLSDLTNSFDFIWNQAMYTLNIALQGAQVIANSILDAPSAVVWGIQTVAMLAQWQDAYQEQIANVGVSYNSGYGDYAEWLEKGNEGETIQTGDIVGMTGGKISKNTAASTKMMVVSQAPIVLGNTPPKGKESKFEKVAFMGQVKVRVKGAVHVGDYIIASGNGDGYGIGVNPKNMRLEDYPKIAGVAWGEAKMENGIALVNTAVGINNNDLVTKMTEQQKTLDAIVSYLKAKDPDFKLDVPNIPQPKDTVRATTNLVDVNNPTPSFNMAVIAKMLKDNPDVLRNALAMAKDRCVKKGINVDKDPRISRLFDLDYYQELVNKEMQR